MFHTLILDANGNGIGVHAYVEQPAALPAGEIACDAAQAQRPGDWMHQNGALVPNPAGLWKAHQEQANAALKEAVHVAARCLLLGQSVPAAWQTYGQSLHNITQSDDGTVAALPTAPMLP